ncbi:MAG TPA: alkaline phosphatase PhoX, partial [Burkholderiales bacterium]
MNHENIQREFLLAPALSAAEAVQKMKNAHGIPVIEVRQDDGAAWPVVRPSRFARGVTTDTPIRISGPAARASTRTRPDTPRPSLARSS